MKPFLSILLSFRNEREVITELARRLHQSLRPLEIGYEIIFVNDSSDDGSLDQLKKLAQKDPGIKIINMSRPFGHEQCLMAGMKYAKGDGVILMDADLQDPPELIPEMIQKWRDGADVVYGVRTARDGESTVKLCLTQWAYRILGFASQMNLPVEAGNFRLLSRRVVQELLRLNEKDPFIRMLVRWVGFKQVPVFYRRAKRFAGKTHFSLLRSRVPLRTLLFGILSFSEAPLFLMFLGGLVLSLTGIGCFFTALATSPQGIGGPRWPFFLMALVVFLWGTQWLGMGIVGLYLGRVYQEAKGRPNYIVESLIGFENEPIREELQESATALPRRE